MHCSCTFFSTKYESLSKNCRETFEAVHCIYCRCCKQIKLIVNWMWLLRLVLSFCLNVRQMKLICKISGYVWEIISANMYMYLSWNYCKTFRAVCIHLLLLLLLLIIIIVNVSSIWNNSKYNLWKKIYSKCSLSHCIQGHNLYPQVTGFMHAFSYKFFSFLQFTRGNLRTKILH